MNVPKRYFGLILLSLILNGCIPIPIHEEEPYSVDAPNLKVGSTTKNEVIKQFGEPGATYSRESMFVYTHLQKEVILFGGGYGNSALGQQHFLVLSFDEDGVLSDYFIESSRPDSYGCIEAGWCVGYYDRVLRLADKLEDYNAKQFNVAEDKCGLYIYGPSNPFMGVSLDGENKGSVFSKRYFQNWKIDPGMHEVNLFPQSRSGRGMHLSLSLDCVGGEIVFIRYNQWSVALEQERDDAESREQIEKRHLVIPGPMRKISDS